MFCRTTEMCGCFEDRCVKCAKPPVIEERWEPTPDSYSFKVPKRIRKNNDEAYTPQLVSIGPFHHGKKELEGIEKQKERYMESFRRRNSSEKMNEISRFIQVNEVRILAFYSEITGQIEKSKFERMILHDAIFIIELFVMNYECAPDFLLEIPARKFGLSVDLQLLENQLPFFLLEDLCKLSIARPTFMYLAYNFFRSTDSSFCSLTDSSICSLTDSSICSLPDQTVGIKHFTDLRRSVMLKGYKYSCMKRNGKIADLPSAANLTKSGVRFKRSEEKCLLNIRFEKRIFSWLNCEGAELQIPNLELYEDTEKELLNVVAFEQLSGQHETWVSSYIELINSLINTQKDVQLLVDKEIISNFIGDIASVANLFNRLSLHIRTTDSSYYGICEDLKKHYKNPWNHTKASLKRVFCDIVKGTGAAGLIFITLLTLIQTITGIIQASG